MSATLTPRVRILAVCDEAVRSEVEADVFHLEGVRQRFTAETFPCIRTLGVYLLLSYPRRATFEGHVRLFHEPDDWTVRYAKFAAAFEDEEFVPISVDLDNCVFPEAGPYRFEIRFWTGERDVVKGEIPFDVSQAEE